VRLTVVIAAGLLAIGAASAAIADDDYPRCTASFDSLLADKVFARYPARLSVVGLQPHAPDVRSGMPHLYRTVLREEVKGEPNFAGHYILIRIGCGAATGCPAITDTKTGKVYFPPALKAATALLVDTGDTRVQTLNFRKDSRLLVLFGTPNEDSKKDGMSFYVWRSNRLTLVRFVPLAKLCETKVP
jgi:hypothetical protein